MMATEPLNLEGWAGIAVQGVEMFPEFARYLEPTVDGHYEGVGHWRLEIDRGGQLIVINSPPDGTPEFGPIGSIKAGDKVTGWWLHPYSWMMFGNSGCIRVA